MQRVLHDGSLTALLGCLWLAAAVGAVTGRASGADPPPSYAQINALAETDPAKAGERLLASPTLRTEPWYGNALVETARSAGRRGDFESALKLLVAAVDHFNQNPRSDPTATIIARLGIASAGRQLGRHALVIEHAEAVFRDRENAAENHRLTAGRSLLQSLLQTREWRRCLDVTSELIELSDAARGIALEQSFAVAAAAMQEGDWPIAAEAYRLYLAHESAGRGVAEAKLGIAWAAAMGNEPPEAAQQLLADFASDFPDHRDMPHVLRVQADLLEQLDRADEAQQLRLRVLSDFDDEASSSALDAYIGASAGPWTDAIRDRWLSRLKSSPLELTAAAAASSLVTAVRSQDDRLWKAAAEAMVTADRDGGLTHDVLNRLRHDDRLPIAEQLAVDLLNRLVDLWNAAATADPSLPDPPRAFEAACRWAGIQGRWSMLALAAGQVPTPESRTYSTAAVSAETAEPLLPAGRAIDRIFAESLMQLRRGREALPWWDAIIDRHEATDFATLLRGAEVAVAYSPLDAASERLAAAEAAAGDDEFHLLLVRMLQAETAVRRAHMDEARELLSQIVRGSDAAAELRPRAQWMVGETFFLQNRFAEAIDAYRRVDQFDSGSPWSAAALLQAGKAFEKLTRSREAATCYTALLSRFADTPHADEARTRLAQLGGDGGGTLRR